MEELEAVLRKRFEGFTDEELQSRNGENEETMKFWNREDAIDEAIETDKEELLDYTYDEIHDELEKLIENTLVKKALENIK